MGENVPDRAIVQTAPWPDELEDLVAKATLWPGWEVNLYADYVRDPADTHSGLAAGTTLVITTLTHDTYHPDNIHYRVRHIFGVPAATYNRQAWQRWLFDRYVDVWRHEAMESFEIDGEHPYAATHGPGDDPYVVHDYSTDVQRRTSFRGVVKEDDSE